MTSDPTQRAFSLLELLRSRPQWSANELAERLDTSVRTVRRDVSRLRGLGYSVRVRPGPGGTYQLVSEVSVPPLLFNPDKIGAIVAGLRLLHARLADDAATSALLKLDQILPAGLRSRATAVHDALEILNADALPAVAAGLDRVADAVARAQRIRFCYVDQHDRRSQRLVHPYRAVVHQGRWYLIGYDLDRADWRLFRFDRVTEIEPVRGTFRCPVFPDDSIQQWFATDFGRQTERHA